MLTQYRFHISFDRESAPGPEWGYRLYSALLEQAPQSFGERAHTGGVTPISQFFRAEQQRKAIWTVNLLGAQAEAELCETMDKLSRLQLKNDDFIFSLMNRSISQIDDVDALLKLAEKQSGVHKLRFCTPTAFKSRGHYLNLPTSRLIVQSLVKKWNGCIAECPIEDEDGGGVDALAAGLYCRSFRLQDRTFCLKGNNIPGFTGIMTFENQLSGFHRQLLDALLFFAGYSGIGIKTTLGMGGIERQSSAQPK